jgi:hypothetical protein
MYGRMDYFLYRHKVIKRYRHAEKGHPHWNLTTGRLPKGGRMQL